MPDFIEVDAAKFKSSLQFTLNKLTKMERLMAHAVTLAMQNYGEYVLAQVQELAPVKTGFLRDSGHINGPTRQGEFIVFELAFDAYYAEIQDIGGFVLPKRAKRLFIPLRPGVKPIRDPAARRAAGYQLGVDFVFAKFVKLPGSRYLSSTIRRNAKNADRIVGRFAEQILEGLLS
jgi:hypothetical protein